jgi:hypothetical protein
MKSKILIATVAVLSITVACHAQGVLGKLKQRVGEATEKAVEKKVCIDSPVINIGIKHGINSCGTSGHRHQSQFYKTNTEYSKLYEDRGLEFLKAHTGHHFPFYENISIAVKK